MLICLLLNIFIVYLLLLPTKNEWQSHPPIPQPIMRHRTPMELAKRVVVISFSFHFHNTHQLISRLNRFVCGLTVRY